MSIVLRATSTSSPRWGRGRNGAELEPVASLNWIGSAAVVADFGDAEGLRGLWSRRGSMPTGFTASVAQLVGRFGFMT